MSKDKALRVSDPEWWTPERRAAARAWWTPARRAALAAHRKAHPIGNRSPEALRTRWTPERRAALSERMKKLHAEHRADIAQEADG